MDNQQIAQAWAKEIENQTAIINKLESLKTEIVTVELELKLSQAYIKDLTNEINSKSS